MKRTDGVHWRLAAAALLALLTLVGCSATHAPPVGPHSIILFIGDGMGVSHVTAARVESGSLNMERLTTGGFLATHAVGSFVTDSAASGTAIATGELTTNGAISVSPSGEPLKTVLEYAEENGMATGLVVTCSITHATPAVFVAHVPDRDDEALIAEHIAASGVDVMFGGGLGHFLPASASGSLRTDERDLLYEMEGGITIVRTEEEFDELLGAERSDEERVAGLFYRAHPPVEYERAPSLARLTAGALNVLAGDEDGFFLMVEGSQIDWAGHENNSDWIIAEMLDFDAAVGIGMDFAERDGRTLVVVTSDHETGGYAVLDGSVAEHRVSRTGFTTGGHSASMVPLLAYGPGSAHLGGIHDNAFLGSALIEYVRAAGE